MILSFYQSIKTVPPEWQELAATLHLSAMQRFWKIEVPFALPSLTWNMMLSLSAAWFFVVASEALTVNQRYFTARHWRIYRPSHKTRKFTSHLCCGRNDVLILASDVLLFKALLAWAEISKPWGDSMTHTRPLV